MRDSEFTTSRYNPVEIIRDILFFFCLGVFLIQTNLVLVSLWRNTYGWFDEVASGIEYLYFNVIQIALIVCIVITFFITKPNLTRIVIFLSLIVIGRTVALVQNYVYFYQGILLIVAAYRISAKKILAFFLSVNVPLLFITVFMSRIGCLENRIELGRNREFLGYTWTTTPVMIFAYAVFAYLVLRRGKVNIIEFLLINILNYWFFVKTNTKFTFLIIFLITLFFALMELFRGKRITNLERNLLMMAPWLCFVLVYLVSVAFNPQYEIMLRLNRLLSNRLRQCEYSLRIYDILPFGQPIVWVNTSNATVDNPATYVDTAYLQTLLKYGWLAVVVLLIISSYIVYRAYKEHRYYIALTFAFIIIFGLFEQQMLYFHFDIILMLAFANWNDLLPDDYSSKTIQLNEMTNTELVVDR